MNKENYNKLNIPSGYHLYSDVKPSEFLAISPIWDFQDEFRVNFRETLWMNEAAKNGPKLIAWKRVFSDNVED